MAFKHPHFDLKIHTSLLMNTMDTPTSPHEPTANLDVHHPRIPHPERRSSAYSRKSLSAAAEGLSKPDHGFGDGTLQVDGPWFKDSTGRTIMLRGVNVSGNAKLPFTPYMPSHVRDGFFDDINVSFVGRPFPLDEADEHFARLHFWGFNFVRLNVTWEALEHAGP